MIDGLVRRIGGLTVLCYLFRRLNPCFDIKQQRYNLVMPEGSIDNPIQPLVPFGYLLHLAVKYPYTGKVKLSKLPQLVANLLSISTDLVTLFDLQIYNKYIQFANEAHDVIPFLRSITLSDTVFKVPQMRPSDARLMLHGIIAEIPAEFIPQWRWKTEEAIKVADILLSCDSAWNGPLRITQRSVADLCPDVPFDNVALILDELFSSQPSEANQGILRSLSDERDNIFV